MKAILESYLRRLTNLSGNNRSLLLLRLISDQFLDLHELDHALDKPSFEIVNDLIADKKNIPLCAAVDPRDASSNQVSFKLKRIDRIEKFIFEERGSKDLYVGWPFIRGKLMDGTLVRCPLIFFPVELQQKKGYWTLVRRQDVNITLNKSFLLAYAFYNQVSVDEELLELVIDDFDFDSTVFRTQLYEILKNSNLEVNFNQENFLDQLKPFRNYQRKELEDMEKPGKLKLYPEAALGIFPQSGSYLVPDYVQLLEEDNTQDLESFFYQRTKKDPEDESGTRFSDKVLEENTYVPFEVDAYQEKALKMIKKGNSMVVKGPPGTGKSQLIANLVADFTARGKNVLLVCQKRAALDVVFKRLQEKGLHDFIGLVHDFKNDRKSIFEKISQQIERLGEYEQKNNGLDSIQLERSFAQSSRKIEALTEKLEEYRSALFDESEAGKAIKELYLTSDPNQKSIYLKQAYSDLTYHRCEEFENKLTRYFTYYREFENKNHFWAHEHSFSNFQSGDFVRIKDAIRDARETFDNFLKNSSDLLHQQLDYESIEFFLQKIDELKQFISNLDNEQTYRFFKNLVQTPPDEDGSWLVELERVILQSFKGAGPEISLESSELGRFQESLEHAIKARKGPFSWLRWKLFSKDQIFITRVLVANDLRSNKEGFAVLLERIDNRLNFEHNLSRIEKKEWLKGFPKNLRKIDIQNWFFYQKLAFKTYLLFKELRSIEAFVSFKTDNRREQIERLEQFRNLLEQVPIHKQLWLQYLSENQLRLLLTNRVEDQKITDELDRDFDALHDYHHLRDSFTNSEKQLIEALEEETDTPEQALHVFRNSLALSWIEHIEAKYPVLRSISTLEFEQNVKELRQAVEDKRRISTEILLLKLREKTYEDLEYNRLNNRVTYRDLMHQVTKKKRIWPLRKVVNEFSEEIFKLLPCWMSSPESASAIFPMKEQFDLVIFDEASQCFAERGIPAMYRAKQIVVAGDEKQLRPFDLYRVKWEDEERDKTPELDVDSLLELSVKHLPDVSLQGHYRSKALELIEFSNQNFYKGQLRMLPEKNNVNSDEPAITYLKVDGIWEDGKNEIEATAVVDLIEKLRQDKPTKDIGVVTFNIKQQGLILDFLDKKAAEWGIISENLFVKNIENVQGDERDIIIFTTAYSTDKKGVLRLQFGSLNVAGGENRLNVAVTRAREKVYVVSSLTPGQLNTEQTKNEGPKLLKSYLEYAWKVSEKKWVPQIAEPKKSRPGWYLYSRLIERFAGLNPKVQLDRRLPFGDVTLRSEKNYLGLIITDDDYFHDAESIKDIYVYSPEVFLTKNWPYLQVNSREFWRSPEKLEDRLRLFFNRVSED